MNLVPKSSPKRRANLFMNSLEALNGSFINAKTNWWNVYKQIEKLSSFVGKKKDLRKFKELNSYKYLHHEFFEKKN